MEVLEYISEIGRVRKINEDAVIVVNHPKNNSIKLLGLADGMGGKNYGDIASNYTLNTIKDWFIKKKVIELNNSKKLISSIKKLIQRINKELIDKYGKDCLGTTLSLAIINKKETLIFNCGDSRVYTYSKRKLVQITEDDSNVWSYYKYENVLKDDLRYFSMNNVITACVGIDPFLCRLNVSRIDNNYEMLLLFSDGVTDLITDKKIRKIVRKSKGVGLAERLVNEACNVNQKQKVPRRLIKKFALKFKVPYMGKDNASCIVFKPDKK